MNRNAISIHSIRLSTLIIYQTHTFSPPLKELFSFVQSLISLYPNWRTGEQPRRNPVISLSLSLLFLPMNCTTLISHIYTCIWGTSRETFSTRNSIIELVRFNFIRWLKLGIRARSWITIIGPVPRIDPRRSVAWPVARSVKGTPAPLISFGLLNALVCVSLLCRG